MIFSTLAVSVDGGVPASVSNTAPAHLTISELDEELEQLELEEEQLDDEQLELDEEQHEDEDEELENGVD